MLLERKILGIIQFRLGPNKIFFKGWFQFLKDLIKLCFKGLTELKSFYFYWLMTITVLLFMAQIFIWFFLPFENLYINLKLVILRLILILVLKLILLIFLIWLIYSVYRTLRIYRILIQVISSDIVIIVVFLLMVYLVKRFSILNFFDTKVIFVFIRILIFVFWIIGILIEVIRLPYDFYERESELISGFTIEIRSIIFLFIILVEYLEIIYFIIISLIFFFNFSILIRLFYLVLGIKILFLVYFRGIFIRHRFDKIILLLWKIVFPLALRNSILIALLALI